MKLIPEAAHCGSVGHVLHRVMCSDKLKLLCRYWMIYRGADKSLARPTSRCILFDGENISFHVSLVLYIYIYIYIYSIDIPPIIIIKRIYEHQNLLSL
jgi:hypothetical protein